MGCKYCFWASSVSGTGRIEERNLGKQKKAENGKLKEGASISLASPYVNKAEWRWMYPSLCVAHSLTPTLLMASFSPANTRPWRVHKLYELGLLNTCSLSAEQLRGGREEAVSWRWADLGKHRKEAGCTACLQWCLFRNLIREQSSRTEFLQLHVLPLPNCASYSRVGMRFFFGVPKANGDSVP